MKLKADDNTMKMMPKVKFYIIRWLRYSEKSSNILETLLSLNFTEMDWFQRFPSKHLSVQSKWLKHLKKTWNMFKVNKKDSRARLLMSLWCLYCYLWTHFTHLSNTSIVEFEQVIICWVIAFFKRALICKSSLYCLV